VRQLAKTTTFNSAKMNAESKGYKESQFICTARWSGLVKRTGDDIYQPTQALKDLAGLSDTKIMAFASYFLKELGIIDRTKLSSDHPLAKNDAYDSKGHIKLKYRRYHPNFHTLFKVAGIPSANIEVDPFAVKKKPSVVSPEPMVSKTLTTKLREDKIQEAILVSRIKAGGKGYNTEGMTTAEALKVVETMEEIANLGCA
jgi:hypothetical protein